jgi:U3 small nucleolar RNA-associated protein MPP10
MSNLPSLSLETALPPTQRPSHLLAPEEVFTPPTASALTARSELTPAQKKALHNKEKKAKRKQRDALDAGVKAFGSGGGLGGGASRKKGKSGEKGAKEAALKGLVKDGKGVTVIGKLKKDFTGKGERKDGKGKGGGGEGMVQDGARLKL